MTSAFSKQKDQMLQLKGVQPQSKVSPLNTIVGIQKYQRGIQPKAGDSKSKVVSKAPINKLILSSNVTTNITTKQNYKSIILKDSKVQETKGGNKKNYSSNPYPLQHLSLNMKNQLRMHNKNSTSLHISSNNINRVKQLSQNKYSSTATKPQGKVAYSYCNTISSTNNTDNNNNALIEAKLITIIDQMKSEHKVEFLNTNIFLNKLISYFSSVLSPSYEMRDLIKNEELKGKFTKLEHKLSYYALCNNYSNVNVLNADMLSNDCITKANPVSIESNNRKDIYKAFFDFYNNICSEIEEIFVQLPEVQELKNIEEVNSKISSLNSKITLTNKNRECDESSILSNIFLGNEHNYNVNITKENITNWLINKQTPDFMSDQVPSILISSINSEFYQQLIDESANSSYVIQKEKKCSQRYHQAIDNISPVTHKPNNLLPTPNNPPKEESKFSEDTIHNDESSFDQTVLDEMKTSTFNINPIDYCHTKGEYEKIKLPFKNGANIPIIKKGNEDKCIIF